MRTRKYYPTICIFLAGAVVRVKLAIIINYYNYGYNKRSVGRRKGGDQSHGNVTRCTQCT